MRLVIYPPVEPERLAAIRSTAEACPGNWEVVNAADVDEARGALETAEAFFGKLTPELLAAARRLGWVQSPTASLEHYLFPELIAHPCQLTNMRGLFSDVIAEHVFGMLLALVRQLPTYARQQPAGRWEPLGGESSRPGWAAGPGVVSAIDRAHGQLAGGTLGIVGLGEIGRAVAVRGRAFDLRVVAVDPRCDAVPEAVAECRPPDQLRWLLAASEFVVIAAPHTPRTVGLFGAATLARMKPAAYLVNVGRGAIVDTAALTAALQAGRLAGAALDVVDPEPLPPEHPLWRMPNVLITPHMAGYSPLIAGRHLELLLDNLRRFAHGQPLRNVVSKENWY